MIAGACPGPLRFARYACPPNALGLCGPEDAAGLREAAGAGDLDELARLGPAFEGAWPYLQLIAACNGLSDPLDPRVAEAYWVGNALLEAVPGRLLAASLEERFGGRLGPATSPVAEAAVLGGLPHHSFHVLAVSPWLGLLRSGREQPAMLVLERCRVRWGRVVALEQGHALVRSRPLVLEGSRLVLGGERLEVARREPPGAGRWAAPLAPGDRVSLHWDWVCEPLTLAATRRLAAYTARSLAVANAGARPGPAVAADAAGG